LLVLRGMRGGRRDVTRGEERGEKRSGCISCSVQHDIVHTRIPFASKRSDVV
jgi:hypothetical protein